IKYVAEVGYDEVEIYGYQNGQYFGLPASEFYALVKDTGMSIRSAHYLTGRSEADWSGTMTNGWDQAIEDAVAAGQSHMVLSWLPESERSMDHYQSLPDLLNRAGEQCKAAGLQLAYHNHDFEFISSGDFMPMYHILDNTDPELLKMELDLYWIVLAGHDPIEFFEKYAGRTELWHVKDLGERDGEQTTVEVGNGSIDFKKIFAESATAGMQAFFVEQDHSPDPKASVRTSFGALQKILA
ncbi:MAG: sugar phosphate isomerase/epimerase, partial [Bacteroidota bacterium]